MSHLCYRVGLYAHIHVCIPAHALRGSCVIDAVCVFAYVLRRVMPLPLRWAMRISAVLYEASLPSCRIVCIYTRMHPCLCLAKQSCHCHRVRPCVFQPMPYMAIVSLCCEYSRPCLMRHLCHRVRLYAHIHVCIPAHALRGSHVIAAVCVLDHVLRGGHVIAATSGCTRPCLRFAWELRFYASMRIPARALCVVTYPAPSCALSRVPADRPA